ncbi:MAG TPA: acyl-CoA dehydrogenase family protein [Aliidongia sp.]|uniref:acyl-CoA dehydrogenase family protein n=1 Tax=Aliidongia sp. TaxID=1914230 RepID=UPI002DDDA671|nr:acyl-CoA dehydrogenase family protein [Aliidongia sp.]HEV2675654.1 acyl-CoA dehydrogenase family protein [Aliidongia sp.]
MPVTLAKKDVATHEVVNQVPFLPDVNLYEGDAILRETVDREGGGWAEQDLAAFGAVCGSEATRELARQANRHLPELKTHDRRGERIDLVEYHPSYHELMRISFGAGVHSYAWNNKRPGAHVARAALSYLWNQAENGTACPTGMNYSAVPIIQQTAVIGETWAPALNSTAYDPRPIHISKKTGATIGMTLTEKQGGSDLRANTTRAVAVDGAGPGALYEITGHKWFCSAPMCDGFYTLAYTDRGPTCFIIPRILPDGSRNNFFIQRLKDKLGNRSNASSEVEFRNTLAYALSEEGRGIRAAVGMIHLTRLDFTLGSAAMMRHALTQALHHTSHRSAFQRRLIDQPLMRNVLADLAVDSEASTLLAFRVARACDEVQRGDEGARRFERIAVAIAKYWTCKRASAFIHEALECHGGNGFVEEHLMARLYREAPLNSIWEGSGNVIVLDVMRAFQREPDSIAAFLDEVKKAKNADHRLDKHIARLEQELSNLADFEHRGRHLVEMMVFALQGALLVQHSTPAVADAFCAARLDGRWGRAFGTLPPDVDMEAILSRARLAV